MMKTQPSASGLYAQAIATSSINELSKDVKEKTNTDSPPSVVDVIVIGLGSMGSSACYHLARRGLRVLGIEQFDIPHDRGSHTGQSRLIRKAYGEDTAYVPLLERAYQNWRVLEEETGEKVYFPTGLVYFGGRENPFFHTIRQSAASFGIGLNILKETEQQDKFPEFRLPGDYQYLEETDAGFVTPERCILLMTREAIARGAVIQTKEKVISWKMEFGTITVKTDKGTYRARKLVITAGAWAGKMIPDLSERLKVTRQVLGWFEAKEPDRFKLGNFPCWYCEEDGRDFYGFPILPNEKFGGPAGLKVALHYPGETVADADHANRSVDDKEAEVLIDFLKRRLPNGFHRLLTLKTCLYTYSPDEHFIIDHLPGYGTDVTVAAGFSGHGFKFASVVGEILADLAMEGITSLPAEFLRLDRSGEGH